MGFLVNLALRCGLGQTAALWVARVVIGLAISGAAYSAWYSIYAKPRRDLVQSRAEFAESQKKLGEAQADADLWHDSALVCSEAVEKLHAEGEQRESHAQKAVDQVHREQTEKARKALSDPARGPAAMNSFTQELYQ